MNLKFVFLIALFPLIAKAQIDSSRKNPIFTIKTDLAYYTLNFISGYEAAGISIELGFLKRHALMATWNYNRFYETRPTQNYTSRYDNFIVQYKLFWRKEKPQSGFYCGAYAKFNKHRFRINTFPQNTYDLAYFAKEEELHIGGGGAIGFQETFGKHFQVDAGIGFGVLHRVAYKLFSNADHSGPYTNDIPTKLDPRLNVSLGYSF
jgi:hypothetical protein